MHSSIIEHIDTAQLLSRRTANVEEAAILRMARKARELAADGRDIVSLTVGEPDFDTPEHIRRAAAEAIEAGYTHYGPVAGFPDLRQAIANKLRDENGLDYAAAEIVLANGAKQAITDVAFALLDAGDEVILLGPCWAAYEGIIRMAGGVPVMLAAGVAEGFKVPAARIAAAITPRTKAILLNSPCNPSGAVLDHRELEAIAELARAHPRLVVISDEIYEYIVFDRPHRSIGALPGMKERTVVINGFSKGFAMTGWRLGYLAAPEPIARAAAKVQGTFTAGANAFVQRAALAALEGSREPCRLMCEAYRRRRDLMVGRLRAIPGIRVAPPEGTFYAFPDIGAHLGKRAGNHLLDTSVAFCDWLLEAHGLATVPGSAFGDDNALRLSFAADEDTITRGLDRLAAAVASLG